MIEKENNIPLINKECRYSEAAEEIIDKYFPVLDDGFVALKDYMGNDYAIERAARISYGKGTRTISQTKSLIRYLMRSKHTSPFEQVELCFHIRLPMDVHRQLVRHRTANLNEYSTRYSLAIDSQQKTDADKWRLQSNNNKQGSSGFLPKDGPDYGIGQGNYLSGREVHLHEYAKYIYNERIAAGVAREQARKDLPLSTYTEAYWKCDLHNLFHFLKLRCDSHAQLEIRSYANVIAGMVKRVCPLSFDAWVDYSLAADNFTRLDKLVLEKYIEDQQQSAEYQYGITEYAESIGMSKREIEEFYKKIVPAKVPSFDLDLATAKDLTHWHKEQEIENEPP